MLYKYDKNQLQTWSTNRLGCLYMNTYHAVQSDDSDRPTFNSIISVLRLREFRELQPIYHHLRNELNKSVSSSVEERRERQDMLDHFHYHILEGTSQI